MSVPLSNSLTTSGFSQHTFDCFTLFWLLFLLFLRSSLWSTSHFKRFWPRVVFIILLIFGSICSLKLHICRLLSPLPWLWPPDWWYALLAPGLCLRIPFSTGRRNPSVFDSHFLFVLGPVAARSTVFLYCDFVLSMIRGQEAFILVLLWLFWRAHWIGSCRSRLFSAVLYPFLTYNSQTGSLFLSTTAH